MHKYDIDQSAPLIYGGGWQRYHDEGWRWDQNLYLDDADKVSNQAIVKELQHRHGRGNVTIGHAWDETECRPIARVGLVGVFVRDVEDQVRSLRQDLEEWANECI